MTVDTNTMVSITEANQNFSKVARLVDELGSVVILKNNVPRYLVIDFSKADESAVAKDEDVLEISKRLLAQNKEAYEVLAKWKDWVKSWLIQNHCVLDGNKRLGTHMIMLMGGEI